MTVNMSAQVLVLNNGYQPVSVVSVRDAMVLIVRDAARSVVTDPEVLIRSATDKWEAPKVVALTKWVEVPDWNRPQRPSHKTIIAKYGGECCYCTDMRGDTVDHVHPRSQGGGNTWANMVAACRSCNNRKGDRLLADLGWKMRYQPSAPTATGRMFIGVGKLDPAWADFIPASAGLVAV